MSQCYDELLVQDLNEILKGCHMGVSVFTDLLGEAQNDKFKSILKKALECFHQHEMELSFRIRSFSAEIDDSPGLMASVSGLVEKFKAVMADSDEELLKNAIRAMDMAMKACQVFDEKHPAVTGTVRKILDQLMKDYRQIYRELTEFRLNL